MNPKTSKFMIHKDLICYHSPFFKAAFNGNFLEGQTQEMTLEADVVAFGIVVSWFYTKKLVNSDGKTPDLITLAQSWILAEYFKMPKLQNQIMVEIHVTLLYINDPWFSEDATALLTSNSFFTMRWICSLGSPTSIAKEIVGGIVPTLGISTTFPFFNRTPCH
jgi:hypothetical protein